MQALLGFLELSRGHPADSVRLLEPLPARLRELGYEEPSHLQGLPNLVEAYVECSADDDGTSIARWYERRSQSLNHPLGWSSRAVLGLLAAAASMDAALARFDAALALQLPEPLENGRTLLALGIVLRRAGGAMRAPRARDACAIFDRLGASRWAERARGELARVAGRPPSRENLTVTESRVADLVAEGRSNKEVAAELFVTVKGVEAHLSRIYRKLGIKSRAELTRPMRPEARRSRRLAARRRRKACVLDEMEAAGIEPASAAAPNRASTSVVCASHSPAGRFADDLPSG